jgi:hypothetical protein
MISVFGTSNKPFLWKNLYENISSTSQQFEMIFTGPEAPGDWSLPSNFKYIKTNVKPSQAQYAASLYTQGEYVLCIADDASVNDKFLDIMLNKFLKYAGKIGHNRIVMAPEFYDEGRRFGHPFIRSGSCKGPNCSLNGGLLTKAFSDEMGGFDRDFIAAYAQIDLAMRMWEYGGVLYKTNKAEIREKNYSALRICGNRTVKKHDRPLLTKLWHRKVKEGEIIPEEDMWGYHQPGEIISKKRLFPLNPFSQDGLLEHSQGDTIPYFKWD